MKYQFTIPEYKRVRVIVSTDAACEADDPFAIAHALLSPKLDVKAVVAEHFMCEGSMERSFAAAQKLLERINAYGITMTERLPWGSNMNISNDGMILYTRWDYVDRGAGQAHHAWTCFPDGRDPREVNGNTREKLADEIGITRPTLASRLKGDSKWCWDEVIQVARITDTSLNELAGM